MSAVFAVAQCLTVRLSVTLWCIVSMHTAEDIVKLFLGPVPHDYSFQTASADTQFPRELSTSAELSGGAKYTGWQNFAIFNRNRRLISETVRPMVARER